MPTAKVKAVTAGRRVARVDARRSGRGTVEAVAKATGIPAHVVRYYARIGLVKPQRDPCNGQRSPDRSAGGGVLDHDLV